MSESVESALAERLASLEAEVAELRRREQARELVHRYAAGCDTNDAAAVAGCFAAEATLRANTRPYEGRAAIEEFYRAGLAGTSVHLQGPAQFGPAGDVLQARMPFIAVRSIDGHRLIWGTYTDRYVEDAAKQSLRFAERQIAIDGVVRLAVEPQA